MCALCPIHNSEHLEIIKSCPLFWQTSIIGTAAHKGIFNTYKSLMWKQTRENNHTDFPRMSLWDVEITTVSLEYVDGMWMVRGIYHIISIRIRLGHVEGNCSLSHNFPRIILWDWQANDNHHTISEEKNLCDMEGKCELQMISEE